MQRPELVGSRVVLLVAKYDLPMDRLFHLIFHFFNPPGTEYRKFSMEPRDIGSGARD